MSKLLLKGFSACPVCESHNTTADDQYTDIGFVYYNKCNDCGCEWQEVYKYSYTKITKYPEEE